MRFLPYLLGTISILILGSTSLLAAPLASTVSITSPASGATVSGTISVSGAASGASKVELKVDSGAYQLASGTSSWSKSLNTASYANGSHTLTARATSSTGTQVWASRTVTISNRTTSPPPPPPTTSSSIYWGALIEGNNTYGSGYGDAPWDTNTWNKFEANAGKKASLISWGTQPPWQHDFNYSKSMYEKVRLRGELSEINMNSGSVPLRDIASGKYDASIRTWAQQAAAWGYPFFLRWNWEMNGGWFPWGTTSTNQNTPSDFVNSWRRFHDLTVQAGATNVTWVWCPNIDPNNQYPSYSQLYPGNSYVDWTCLDGFNQSGRTTWKSFATIFKSSYDKLLQVASTKPIMIGETSSEETGGSKAGWITDALSTQLPKYFPRIEALVWFNWKIYQYGYWRPFQIESSSSAQSAFRTAVASSYYRAGGGFTNLPRFSKIQALP